MAIIRLKKYQCDVLVTLNTELESLKRLSTEDQEMSEKVPALIGGIDPAKENQARTTFDKIVGSFRHTTEDELRKLFEAI